jgi:hypothetical protein
MNDRHKEKQKSYRHLHARILQILFEDDPVGINFESNTDEYEPEVGTILPRLKHCHTASDLQLVIHEEFIRWFGSDIAGPVENYGKVAERIWMEWKAFDQS